MESATTSAIERSAAAPHESVARSVSTDPRVDVDVPETRPVGPSSVKPTGNVPLTRLHVNGGVPPVASRVARYGRSRATHGSSLVAIAGVGLTVSVYARSAFAP